MPFCHTNWYNVQQIVQQNSNLATILHYKSQEQLNKLEIVSLPRSLTCLISNFPNEYFEVPFKMMII